MTRTKWTRGTDPSGYGEGFFLRLDTAPKLVLDAHSYIVGVEGVVDVVQVNLWGEMDSSAVAEYGKYNVMSGHVDFDLHEGARQHVRGWAPLSCCGYAMEIAPNHPDRRQGDIYDTYSGDTVVEWGTPGWWQCMAETMWSYGARDVDSDDSGNNLRKLLRAVGVSPRKGEV